MTYGLILTALADPTRRHIFEALREQPRSVSHLSREQTVSRPAVSQHLKVLETSGLVTVQAQGTRRYYAVKQTGLQALRDYLDTFWSDALTAYSLEIHRQMGEKHAGSDNKTIEVPCDRKKAFTVFVHEVNSWWPLAKNTVSAMGGAVAKKVTIEPNLHGKVFEIGHDNTEHIWGSVTRYDPYNGITLDWHIGTPAENASEVTVDFTELGNGNTQVVLIHSRWEALGDQAAEMRAGYNSGWVGVSEQAYRGALTKT